MRVKLYIHIGTHKTGSTAIQNTLLKNYRNLRREKIIYIPDRQLFKKLMFINDIDEELIKDLRLKLYTIIGCYKAKTDTKFVLSQEGLSGDPGFQEDKSFAGYKNAEIIANSLRRITEDIDAKIIVYIRRQDSFMESLYTQKIQEGGYDEFYDFLLNYPKDAFNWEYLLNSYENYFGRENIIVRRYDKKKSPNKNDLIESFANIIGSKSILRNPSFERSNISYSRDAIEIAKMTNKYLSSDEKKSLRNILQNYCMNNKTEKYFFWDFDDRMEFLRRYKISNRNVMKRYFSSSELELFDLPESNSKQHFYPGIKLDDAIVIILRAFLLSFNMKKTKKFLTYEIKKKIRKQALEFFNKIMILKIKHLLLRFYIDKII